MRNAKMDANEKLARRSSGVMAVEMGGAPASGDKVEVEDKAVIRGLAKRVLLSRIHQPTPVGHLKVRVG
jgi:hypothetical protein